MKSHKERLTLRDKKYVADNFSDVISSQVIASMTYLGEGFQATVYKRRKHRRKHTLYHHSGEHSHPSMHHHETRARVLKVPRRRGEWRKWFGPLIKRAATYNEEAPLLENVQRYFDGSLANTRILRGVNGGYVIDQALVPHASDLFPTDLPANQDLRNQLVTVISQNQKMILARRESVAFLGKKGALGAFHRRPRLTNLIKGTISSGDGEETQRLVLVDYDPLDLTKRRDRVTYWFNRKVLLKGFFTEKNGFSKDDIKKARQSLPRLRDIPRK